MSGIFSGRLEHGERDLRSAARPPVLGRKDELEDALVTSGTATRASAGDRDALATVHALMTGTSRITRTWSRAT